MKALGSRNQLRPEFICSVEQGIIHPHALHVIIEVLEKLLNK